MAPSEPSPLSHEDREAEQEPTEGFLLRGGGGRTLSITEALSLVANERRRTLLVNLRDVYPASKNVDVVVEQIAEAENVPSDGGIDEDTRESLRLSLRHFHVPKLEEANVVEFDRADETLRYTGDPVLDVYLDVTEELER